MSTPAAAALVLVIIATARNGNHRNVARKGFNEINHKYMNFALPANFLAKK